MGNKNSFSYSKIDCYKQCGFKFWLKYLMGHYYFAPSIATDFGSLIHETEENIGNAIKAGLPIDYITLKNNIIMEMAKIEKKYPKTFSELDKSDRTYKEKMYEYLEAGIYRFEQFMTANPNLEIVALEKHFDIKFNDVYSFNGAIDRILHDKVNNTYLIQDIKSWPVLHDEKEMATPLQFVFYTLAAKDLFSCTETQITCEYDLPLCNTTQPAGTKGYMTRGIKKINELFGGIETQDFAPTPSPLCHWCEFCPTNPDQPYKAKNLCPYYSIWTRERAINVSEFKWEGLENHPKVLEEYLNDKRLKGELK